MFGVQNILLQWMQSEKRWWSTHLKILWSERENCSTNRCQLQRTWSMSTARWTPNLLCEQIPYWCWKRVCCNQARSSCCIMGLWEIPSFSLWLTLHLTDRSNTPGNNTDMFSQWSNPQIAEAIDKGQCIQFQCWIHPWTSKSSCRLSQLTWMH